MLEGAADDEKDDTREREKVRKRENDEKDAKFE